MHVFTLLLQPLFYSGSIINVGATHIKVVTNIFRYSMDKNFKQNMRCFVTVPQYKYCISAIW